MSDFSRYSSAPLSARKRPTFLTGPLTGVLDLIYPPLCSLCGKLLEGEKRTGKKKAFPSTDDILLCSACRGRIRVEESLQCPVCGGIRYYRGGQKENCLNCSSRHFHFDKVVALGEYTSPMSTAILRMKKEYHSVRIETFARFFIAERFDSLRRVDADYIIPVPMHFLRRVIRGVNSAERLAHEIGRLLKVPCFGDVILRSRWTVRQATLPALDRLKNVQGAFTLRKWSPFFPIRSIRPIAGKKILLVDDVLTTGATCNEIARVLREAGAASVTVAVLARAEGKRHGVSSDEDRCGPKAGLSR